MSDKTAIQWTDATWNPTVGCSIVSPGCTNCYAMKTAAALERRFGSAKYAGLTKRVNGNDVWTGEVRLDEGALDQPLRWRRPRRIFVNSMSDLFHESLPVEEIATVYAIAVAAVHLRGHTFQILTKRAARMREVLASEDFWDQVNAEASVHVMDGTDPLDRRSDDARATLGEYGPDNPPPGIWLGVSAEDQPRADERIPLLLQTPAAVRFISAEPLLGPVDLRFVHHDGMVEIDALNGTHGVLRPHHGTSPRLDWVIAGGESGPGARPMHPNWARSLRDQCQVASVPFFFKQWGEWHVPNAFDGQENIGPKTPFARVGKKAAGRLLDGRTWDEMPR